MPHPGDIGTPTHPFCFMVFKPPSAGSSDWEKARHYIVSEFTHDLIDADEAIARYLDARHLSPLFGAPKPPAIDENGSRARYRRWRRVNSTLAICTLFLSGNYANMRQQYFNLRTLCERHDWHSITGRPLDPLHDRVVFHHIVPSSKEKNPSQLYQRSVDHPEVTNECVILLNCEHHSYHRTLDNQFGKGVYPPDVDWPAHFVAWLRNYQSVHGLTNPHPSGQPGYWPALGGL